MIRFKVIKGSHLLLGVAIVVLTLVLGGFLITHLLSDRSEVVNTQANLVCAETISEAETDSVFASLSVNASLQLDPGTEGSLDIEILSPAAEKKTPSILIYHTHTHEAYDQIPNDPYVAIEAWRTMDQDHSVVRVGAELAELLRSYGFDVVHDVTDHEQNDLATAYTRSLAALEAYKRNFDLYIDLHRDAYVEGQEKARFTVGEQPLAKIMMLIGNGEGFADKPYYKENLAFAEALTARINEIKPNLCKEVLVKDGRYNQNIGIFSILIEVGHNRNTLQEALGSLPYLADGIASLMIYEPDSGLEKMRTQSLE